ncbi:MAG: hypothetical protein MJ127_00615 [Mogibacterium sp.]|nr:hypothetical protein [Mogibacterium sp.]
MRNREIVSRTINSIACIVVIILCRNYAINMLNINYGDFPFGDGNYLVSATIIYALGLCAFLLLCYHISKLLFLEKEEK